MSGIVRKLDELGRVVIPKEMRRILNIKCGSSIEMFINENNQVTLQKFFELDNSLALVENLAEVVFENLKLPCLVANDEKVIVCKGLNKNEFLNKKLQDNLVFKNKSCEELINQTILQSQNTTQEYTYVFTICVDGVDSGYLIIVGNNKLNEETKNNIILLIQFLCNLIKF